MGGGHRRWAVAALALGLHGAARVAGAQTDPLEAARAHFERAVTLFEAGDPRAALAEFERAYALSARPSLLFNLGATHQALHEYPEAVDALRRFLAATEGQRSRQRTEAERALRELDGLMARVRVTCDPATATLTLNGRAATGEVLSVGPGRHVIEASAPGHVTQRVEVTVASGDQPSLRLVLPVVPEPVAVAVAPVVSPPAVIPAVIPVAARVQQPARRPWFTRPWVWAVTGGALAVGATITGVAAVGVNDDFQMRVQTDADVDRIATRGRALAVATDVMALGAVAAGVTALVMLARGDAAPTTTSVSVAPSLGGIGVAGRF
ncbi:MAG: hypothetical protein Q8S73_23175 [Deltaproteobacteria bacterium]|nr:hypothetical protein [Myxococcales bacterium]MDP3217032.1 hypothetical protein [Deltaproteobacteria bacterium]